MISVMAIYENGALRPCEPIELAEGQSVQLSVYPTPTLSMRTPTADEAEVMRRMHAAQSLSELFAIYETLPPSDDDYDLCKALNDNRKASGQRLLYPELETGENP